MAITSGYQIGDPNAIARRYSKGSALKANLGAIQQQRAGVAPAPRTPAPNAGFEYGPDESDLYPSSDDSASAPEPPTQPQGDDQTMRNAAAFGDSPDNPDAGGVKPPPGNATQRWQNPITPQRRYFWATGRVDGRATQSPRNTPTNFDSTFGADRAHMGNAGTTWQQRQDNNNAGVAAVVAQRGLPDSWSPY